MSSESDAVVEPNAATEEHEEGVDIDAGDDNIADEAVAGTPEPQQEAVEAPEDEQAEEAPAAEDAADEEGEADHAEETGEALHDAEQAEEEQQENEAEHQGDALDEKTPEVAVRKEYAPIRRSRRAANDAAGAPRDPALAIIAGEWTKAALSHDASQKTSVVGSGVHVAAKKNGSLPQGDLSITEMTNDTHGMQKLYTRMLTTKMWW